MSNVLEKFKEQSLEIFWNGESLEGFWFTLEENQEIWNGTYMGTFWMFQSYSLFQEFVQKGYVFQFSMFHGIFGVRILDSSRTVVTYCPGVTFDEVMKRVEMHLAGRDNFSLCQSLGKTL